MFGNVLSLHVFCGMLRELCDIPGVQSNLSTGAIGILLVLQMEILIVDAFRSVVMLVTYDNVVEMSIS